MRHHSSLLKRFIFLAFLLLIVSECKKDSKVDSSLPNPYSNLNVGASANNLLSGGSYSSLIIEIQYMPGYAPDAAALSDFQSLLNNTLNKPSGIQIVQKQIASGNKSAYSLQDVQLIERANRSAYTSGTRIGVYMLITDGEYTNNAVLGISYLNTSMTLFGKTIFTNSGGIGQASRTKLEATVMEHESGHLMGLVNIGSPMQTNHQDGANGNHCNNSNCLMYYASETTDVLGFLITGSIPQFDANCMNDLKANGGK